MLGSQSFVPGSRWCLWSEMTFGNGRGRVWAWWSGGGVFLKWAAEREISRADSLYVNTHTELLTSRGLPVRMEGGCARRGGCVCVEKQGQVLSRFHLYFIPVRALCVELPFLWVCMRSRYVTSGYVTWEHRVITAAVVALRQQKGTVSELLYLTLQFMSSLPSRTMQSEIPPGCCW